MSDPPPNAPPALNHLPIREDTSTHQTDSPSGQLVIPALKEPQGIGQSPPTTQPKLSSHTSSFDTSDSSTNFTISLLKPHPTPSQGSAVILPRVETNVFLVITVRGATTGHDCNFVCEQCRRTGNKMEPPSLIDPHSPSNDITPRGGTIQVHFTFSCYSRHHRKEDGEYVLEVIFKDASNPFEPIEVAKKALPYSFDDLTQQAERTLRSTCRRKHPGPAATIHSEDSTSRIDASCISPASDASAQLTSSGNVHIVLVGQRTPLTGCPSLLMGHHPLRESPHMPTNAEKVRIQARMAKREVQINAFEREIKNLKDTFEADSQEKYAAIKDHFNSRVLAIQKEFVERLNSVLGRAP